MAFRGERRVESVVTDRVGTGEKKKLTAVIRILQNLRGGSDKFYRNKTKIIRPPPSMFLLNKSVQ